MKLNVGVLDQMLRTMAGVILLVQAASGTLGPWAYVGIVPLVTGVAGYCPLYGLLGIRTGKQRRG